MLIITSLEGLTKGVDQYVMRLFYSFIDVGWWHSLALDKSALYGWDDGNDWEGEDQECSALSFPTCVG